MCGAACSGVVRMAGPRPGRALWVFQLSRISGYAMLGAFAAGSVQGLAWLSGNTAVVRPVWASFHVAALLLGISLVWLARQPAWVDGLSQSLWRRFKPTLQRLGPRAPWALGTAWALMPCGLLYSAVMVAALSASALQGALIMAAFGAGTAITLTMAPWVLGRLRASASGGWGIRLAGVALMATSGWALWMGITRPSGLWC
jgi:sulfite exporter TauE/SafE